MNTATQQPTLTDIINAAYREACTAYEPGYSNSWGDLMAIINALSGELTNRGVYIVSIERLCAAIIYRAAGRGKISPFIDARNNITNQ